MATPKQTPSIKGSIILTPKGKSLFVSVPNASSYDPLKQEATIVLDGDATAILKAQLNDFVASEDVKVSGVKTKGFVDNLFKEDTDADKNPTGNFRVKAKTAMQYPANLYAANGDEFKAPVGFSIPNRSTIKLSVRPEVISSPMFIGIVLRLQAVKVFDLPEFDDGMKKDEDTSGSFAVPSVDAPVSSGDTPDMANWD